MGQSLDRPIVFAHFHAESVAAIFLSRLRDNNVNAVMTGRPAAQFRAFAPGMVSVLVYEKDADLARRLFDEFDAERGGTRGGS